jgi:hypothetical protein
MRSGLKEDKTNTKLVAHVDMSSSTSMFYKYKYT